MNTSLRIGDPEINVSAQALYKGSEELPEITESVKGYVLRQKCGLV